MGNTGKPLRRIEVLPEHAPAAPPATQPAPTAPVPEPHPAPAEPARTAVR